MATRRNKQPHSYKVIDGQEAKPVYYYGKNAGHGNFMAAILPNGDLVERNGVPVPYHSL